MTYPPRAATRRRFNLDRCSRSMASPRRLRRPRCWTRRSGRIVAATRSAPRPPGGATGCSATRFHQDLRDFHSTLRAKLRVRAPRLSRRHHTEILWKTAGLPASARAAHLADTHDGNNIPVPISRAPASVQAARAAGELRPTWSGSASLTSRTTRSSICRFNIGASTVRYKRARTGRGKGGRVHVSCGVGMGAGTVADGSCGA